MIRILVVSDDRFFRQAIPLLLRSQDMEIVGGAWEAEEAIERTRQLQPDIVLMDTEMPTMDGLRLSLHLVACAPRVKILIVPRETDEEDPRQAPVSSAHVYVLRDFRRQELVDTIRRLHKGGGAA